MKITKRQLRRIIRESISDPFLDHDPDYDHDDPFEDRVPAEIHEYHDFLEEYGHITPYASSVMASFILDRGYGDDVIDVLADYYSLDSDDVLRDIRRQKSERRIVGEARYTVDHFDDYEDPMEKDRRALDLRDYLMGKIFVGDGLDSRALREFEAAADKYSPAAIIYAIYDWGKENAEPGFMQGNVALSLGEDILHDLGWSTEPGQSEGQRYLMDLLDQIFDNVGL